MNPLRWPFRAQFFLGFLICAGLLGYAIFLQLKMGLEPCPLCIFQRLAFAALGLLFLIGALHGRQPPGPGHLRRGLLSLPQPWVLASPRATSTCRCCRRKWAPPVVRRWPS